MSRTVFLTPFLLVAVALFGCGEDPDGASSAAAPVVMAVPGGNPDYRAHADDPINIVYRVNAGGPALAGTPVWQADTYAAPSAYVNWASAGNTVYGVTNAIDMQSATLPPGTPAALFQSERWDQAKVPNMEWTFPVTPGAYEVRLYFAEVFYGSQSPGARVFDVWIDGTEVLRDFDVYAQVGGYAGLMTAFTLQAGSAITITLEALNGNPAVKGIEIIRLAADNPPDESIVHRVNAGGPWVAAADGGPDWQADTRTSPSSFVNASSTGNWVYYVSSAIDTSHVSVPLGTPEALFQTERWDPAGAAEMLWRFPVSPGLYEVRLYFAEIYSGAFYAGARRFSVYAENAPVMVEIDVYHEVGANRGLVKTFSVTSDATLDLEFRHVVENPALKAVEVVYLGPATGPPQPLYRINVGGPPLTTVDGGPAWAGDSYAAPSRLSNALIIGNHTYATSRVINVSHPSVPPGTPAALFQTERYNPYRSPSMEWNFPVSPGTYEVRLYFAEIYWGLWAPGARVFDVLVEGKPVLENVDAFATVGADRGLVGSAIVDSDTLLTVTLAHQVENPALKGIEIVPISVVHTATENVKVNHIQMLASHNAYHIAPPNPTYEFMTTTMPPLDHQLSVNGMRGFELDVHYDGYTLYVFHLPGIDEGSHCYRLADCLIALLGWSDKNLGHHPLVVFFEMKDMSDPMPVLRPYSTLELVEALEREVLVFWPRARLITPAEVLFDPSTEMFTWPALELSRGKAIFIVSDYGKARSAYTYGDKTLAGRAMFVTDNAGATFSPILAWDNPWDTSVIGQGLLQGKLVRTRADMLPGQWSNWNQRYVAIDSGAHMVFTDYPDPSMLEGYEVKLPGGMPSRCNPIIAPPECTNDFIENPPAN